MTTVNVVLAELVPRSFAIRSSTVWALRTAKPLLLWSRVTRPLTSTLSVFSRWVERLFGLPPTQDVHEDPLPSEDELKRLLALSQEKGGLDTNKVELIENVFSFSKRSVMEIAIPRGKVVTMDVGRSFRENMDGLRTLKHSRIPLVDGDLDHVEGVVYLKDILWRLHEDGEPDLKSLARPAFFVPEMRLVQDLLVDFQRRRQHMALVVNEHGGVDGIVTLEDVIEELVGEIQDEFDQETIQITRLNPSSWLAKGTVTLEELEDQFKLALEEETDSVTLGGYFQERLGRVVRMDDEIAAGGWRIKVLDMNGMAPSKFLFLPLGPEPESEP
jgi:CBS domain containing-hemolysin-like protein